MWARSLATAGNARVNIKWAMSGAGDDPAAQTLSAQGVQTMTWTVAHQLKQLVTTLNATTFAHSKLLTMKITFETASWTLASKSFWRAVLVIS